MKKTNQKIPKVGEFFYISTTPKELNVRIPNVKEQLSPHPLRVFDFLPVARALPNSYEYYEYFDDGTDKVVIVSPRSLGKFL